MSCPQGNWQAAKVRKPVPRAGFDRQLGARHPLRILLAEDNAVNQKVALALLDRLGYRADVVANGLVGPRSDRKRDHRQPEGQRRAALRHGVARFRRKDPASALAWLQETDSPPDLILSDVSMPGIDGYDFVRRVRAEPRTARVPILMLTSHTELDDKVAGLEAGADDYLGKTVSPAELELRVTALLARARSPIAASLELEAKVLSVFSLRGGAGTTSIAVNLAAALAELWGIKVPLLDLALSRGHCSVMLNLKPKETLAFLASVKENTVEDKVLEALLAEHDSGVKLLAAPLSPVEAELVTPITVDKVWPGLQSRYPFLVVDAGSQLTDTVLTVLERSDQILLVLSPEMASIKSATDALQVFEQLDFPSHRVLPILNSTFPTGHLRTTKVESALGRELTAAIPYESATFVQAINYGQPFVAENLKSKAGLAISSLAYQQSAAEMEAASASHESPLLSRVRKTTKAAGHR